MPADFSIAHVIFAVFFGLSKQNPNTCSVCFECSCRQALPREPQRHRAAGISTAVALGSRRLAEDLRRRTDRHARSELRELCNQLCRAHFCDHAVADRLCCCLHRRRRFTLPAGEAASVGVIRLPDPHCRECRNLHSARLHRLSRQQIDPAVALHRQRKL